MAAVAETEAVPDPAATPQPQLDLDLPAETPRRAAPLRHGWYDGALARVDAVTPEWWVLITMMLAWTVVFTRLVWLRQNRFGSFSLDMGIFDQVTWLASRMG